MKVVDDTTSITGFLSNQSYPHTAKATKQKKEDKIFSPTFLDMIDFSCWLWFDLFLLVGNVGLFSVSLLDLFLIIIGVMAKVVRTQEHAEVELSWFCLLAPGRVPGWALQ